MELQERDIKLLRALERWGVLGLGQVNGLLFKTEATAEERKPFFFDEIERRDYWTAGYKRLRVLENAGLVRQEHFRTLSVWRPGYLLTWTGHSSLRDRKLHAFATHQRSLAACRFPCHRWTVGIGLALSELYGWQVKSRRELAASGLFSRRKRPQDLAPLPDLWIETETCSAALYTQFENPGLWRHYETAWRLFQKRFWNVRILQMGSWPGAPMELAAFARSRGFSNVAVSTRAEFEQELGQCKFTMSGPQEYFQLEAGPETGDRRNYYQHPTYQN